MIGQATPPQGALYGPQTALALENFGFTDVPFSADQHLVRSLAHIKAAAATANGDLGLIRAEVVEAIVRAAEEMAEGRLSAHLVVDALEGSGGTSINMNVNEVLAARAAQILGGAEGRVHPNDSVNLCQSTNDVIPTALKMAGHARAGEAIVALRALAASLAAKAEAFAGDLKLGRTCLQDAQPMTVGQTFGAYAAVVARHADMLEVQQASLRHIPLGATAIGAGFGAATGYRERALAELSRRSGVAWTGAEDLFDALSNSDSFARLSAEVRAAGLSLGKIGNDLQILSSGPAGGFGELKLPVLQAGSSIMPGKVNPVLPMAMCQIGFVLSGYDVIVAQACQQGQLEINPYEPVIGIFLLRGLDLLTRGAERFRTRCIEGVEVDRARSLANLTASSAFATALLPRLGYEAVSDLVRAAAAQGKSFNAAAEEAGLLEPGEIERLLVERFRSGGRADD